MIPTLLKTFKIFLLLLIGVAFVSCEPDPDMTDAVEKTVAVVAPASLHERLERTAQMFKEENPASMIPEGPAVSLTLEWFDEESEDMVSLGQALAGRDDIMAVIGPFDNDRLALLAQECKRTLKPVIAPVASSEEVTRRYAVKTAGKYKTAEPFLWSLTSTDIPLTELLLSHYGAYQEEHKQETRFAWPAFFAPDNSYGKTFTDWAPFFAGQQDFPIKQYDEFGDTAGLLSMLHKQMDHIYDNGFWQYLSGFCVLESMDQFLDVARERRRWILSNEEARHMYEFPSTNPEDTANDEFQEVFLSLYRTWFSLPDLKEEDLQALGTDIHFLEGYQALSPYADPETGFEQRYEEKFGVKPCFAECKLYDALLLAQSAAAYMVNDEGWPDNLSDNGRFNQSVAIITPLQGVSGELSFDEESFLSTTQATYLEWDIHDGQLRHLHYYRDGAAEEIADWKKSYDERHAAEDFDEQAGEGQASDYAPLTGQYAVLVHASNRFQDYRHGSDVLSVYQLLRKGGFDDDHIILIFDQALPTDRKNPSPGVIRANVVDQDLYGGTEDLPKAVVDYDAATLTTSDITDILLGKSSERIPVVLPPGEGNNVLLYWSGHGRKASPGQEAEFIWRSSPEGSGFTATMLRDAAAAMTFRKLLVIAEPCYGEAVLRPTAEVWRTLGISGANAYEQSWADCWDPDYNFWMCDRFTRNVVEYLEEHPSATYRELFLYCASNTLGSHPRIIPGPLSGNLYVSGPKEFFVKAD
jgi:hypothetical protein